MRAERGSAVVDFVLVSALVSLLFLGLLQLGFALHTRNTLIAAAAEGARLGARADADPGLGAERTRSLIRAQLADRFAESVTADEQVRAGVRVVVLTVDAPVPVVGPFGIGRDLHVSAAAFAERQ